VTGVRNASISTDRDVRGGIGARWNVWYGGTRYNADPHKLSIGIEYQDTLETYLPDPERNLPQRRGALVGHDPLTDSSGAPVRRDRERELACLFPNGYPACRAPGRSRVRGKDCVHLNDRQ
jgi:hypothetical protein